MKYKAIIFDFDDTLVESRVAKWAHHTHVAKKFYNIDLVDDDIRKHWGKPFNVLVADLYRGVDTVQNIFDTIATVKKDFPKYPYKESISTVQKLLDNGIKVGVLSATTNKFLVEDLADLGFPINEFVIIQGADDTSFHKPDSRVFDPLITLLEEEKINKKDILYVGDSIDDFQSSTGAGINYIALTTGLYSQEDFRKAGATRICNSIEEILEHVL
jgi:phosphoglycolate phosphatase-like HAD superfamily hydrolase